MHRRHLDWSDYCKEYGVMQEEFGQAKAVNEGYAEME